MAKQKQTKAPEISSMSVNINVLSDGTVAMVFDRQLSTFAASPEEMAQLGTNLIKASAIAQQLIEAAAQHAAVTSKGVTSTLAVTTRTH